MRVYSPSMMRWMWWARPVAPSQEMRAAHILGVALGGFELAGHAGEEAREDQLGFYADDGVVGAGHADVGLVGGAVGEHALVGGGDVGVGADARR